MRNIVKYDTLTTQGNSIKSGNFNLGVNDTPSTLTGFYNGITPINGGYTIYINKASNGPSIYSPKNDDELIDIVKHLSGTVYSVNDALNWILNQSTMTVVNHNYPNIVTDGLVLNLDAGFVSSYPKNGTTWHDLSGGGNNGTLVNGVGYDSDNGGVVLFDGSNDYIDLGYNPTLLNDDITQEAWVNADVLSSWHGIISNMPSWGTGFSLQMGPTQRIAAMVSGSYLRTSWSPSTGVWYHIVATHRSSDNLNVLYVNGVEENSSTRSISYSTNAVTRIGLFYTRGSLPFEGKMGGVRSYNRALTSEEVQQNYYAGLQRLIPTDGLVLSLDAQNTNLYATSPTTAYDISGEGNNGSLLNGVSVTSEGGGSWDFDNTDDYISLPNDLGYTTEVSVFTWVKIDGSPSGGYHIIFGGQQLEISIPTSGSLRVGVYTNSRYVSNHGSGLSDGEWHHVGFTYNGSTKTAYIDGSPVGSQGVSGVLTSSFSNRTMGKFGSSNTYYLNGKIGETLIFDTSISSDEILTIYNSTKSRYE